VGTGGDCCFFIKKIRIYDLYFRVFRCVVDRSVASPLCLEGWTLRMNVRGGVATRHRADGGLSPSADAPPLVIGGAGGWMGTAAGVSRPRRARGPLRWGGVRPVRREQDGDGFPSNRWSCGCVCLCTLHGMESTWDPLFPLRFLSPLETWNPKKCQKLVSPHSGLRWDTPSHRANAQ